MKFKAIHTINLPDRMVVPGDVFEYDEAAAVNLLRVGACSIVGGETPAATPVVQVVEKVEEVDDSLGLDEAPTIEVLPPVKGKKGR